MKRVELISTPNDQLEEEMISKSKKDETNFKCSPFCSLKKRKKSILKSCIPHMFSVSVKVRNVSVQTSSQCLKCPPCLKDMLEKSNEDNDLSPKSSIDKLHAPFDDDKSIASSKKDTDSKRDEPEMKTEEFSEKSSVVDFPPDSNEVKEEEYIADELKVPISETNLSITKTLQSRGVSEVSLCEDCPPCSTGALKIMKHPSGESDSISTQTSESLLSNYEYKNVPYTVKTPQDDIGDRMSKKSKSPRRESNLSVQINDNISAKSKPSGTESNISKQMDDGMSRISNPSESQISMQLKHVDIKKNNMSDKHDGRISERSSHVSFPPDFSVFDESSNEKPSDKFDDISTAEKNEARKTISETPSCNDCPPCTTEVKNDERKYVETWKPFIADNKQLSAVDGEIGSEQSSTSLVIESNSYSHSEKDITRRRKMGTIAISVRVNYPPYSDEVYNNIPKKTSDQLKSIFSEIGELIAEPNISKIETEESYLENTGYEEDISRIQYIDRSDIAEDRVDELSGKLHSISEEIMHMDLVGTNSDAEGEFSPASSIFESKIKKTSIELKYMASRTKRFSRVISSNEDVLQIRRSVNRRNSPGNDFQPGKENNTNNIGIASGESGYSSSEIDTSIAMINNQDNQFKGERILTNPNYSSVYYLTNEENFIPRKLSNKSHNSSSDVIVPISMGENSNSQPNKNNSEILNNKSSKISTPGEPQSKQETVKANKLSSRSQSLSKEVNTPIPTNNSSNIQSEKENAGTSKRRISKELSSVDTELNKGDNMKRNLSRESKRSSKESNVKMQKDNISEGGSEKKRSGKWNNENQKNSSSLNYESKERISEERGLRGNVLSPSEEMNALLLKLNVVDEQEENQHMWNKENRKKSSFADHESNDKISKVRKLSTKSRSSSSEIKSCLSWVNSSDSLFGEEKAKLSYRNNMKERRLSSKSQASTVNVRTPKTMSDNSADKSKEANVKITTERNIKHSDSIDYQSNVENMKARKSSNESKSVSAEIHAPERTNKISDNKNNEDQTEFSDKLNTSSVHDELNAEEGTARTMSGNMNALAKDNSTNSKLATEKIEKLDEKSKNSSLADELVPSEAIRNNENTSNELKLTSIEANAAASPNTTSNDHLRKSETETPIIENSEKTSIVSETSYTHEGNGIQKNIAKNIRGSSSEDSRSASQWKLDEPKLQSISSVGHQPHSVDREDLEEQKFNTNGEMNLPTPKDTLPHEQLKDETQKSNVQNRYNPPCINCKPFSTDIRIIVKKIPGKQESISSEFSESSPEFIHGQIQNMNSKRSENLICVDCPLCSSLLKASSYQTPNESNHLSSESEVPAFIKTPIKQELSMPKTPGNISHSISEETNENTSANVSANINDENSSIVDSAAYMNEEQTKGKQSIDHTSMSVNFSLGAQSKEDKPEKEEHSQNSLSDDYLPIPEQPKTMTEKLSETNTETTASLPIDNSTISKYEDENPNKVACNDCPACSHIIKNVPKQFSEKRSNISSETSGSLPFSCSGHSGGYDMEKPNEESSENSFCVDCPPCSHKVENISEYSAGLSGEIFSESQLSDIIANIQARRNQKHSLRTETSRSVSSEAYSQNGSIGITKQESHASRSSSEVKNNDSFSQPNRVNQEVSNSFCTNCPPCSNEVEIPITMSNVSSNFQSKSSEAEDLRKKVFSESPTNSDAKSSTTYSGLSTNIQVEQTEEEETGATSKKSEVSQIDDYSAHSDAIDNIEEKKRVESKTSEYNINNPNSEVHSARSNEVNKLVISILDSCTSKMFSPDSEKIGQDDYAYIKERQDYNRENIEIGEENVISNECIDFYLNLITERFKMKAMDVDDDEFERMFEELTRELNTLFCECGKINPDIFEKSLSYLEADINDKKENKEPATNFMNEETLKEMFNEMKIYLEDKLCSCKSKDLNVVTSNAGSRTSKRQSSPIEAEGIGISETKPKSKSFETDVSSTISSDKVFTTMDRKSNLDEDIDTETMKNKIDDEITVHSSSHNELNNSIEKDAYLNTNENKPLQNISEENIAQSNPSNENDKIETSKNTENKNDDDIFIANNSLDEMGIMTTKKSNDDNELVDNKNSEGKGITRSSDEIIQYQQEVAEGENTMLKARRGSSIIDENALTLPQTLNDETGDESKLLSNSNTGSLNMSKKSEDAMKEERMVTSRNSGISELDELEKASKKETFESQAKPSIGISQNLETVDKKETFVTNAKPSITHKNISGAKKEILRDLDTLETDYTASTNVIDDQQESIEKESRNRPEIINGSAEEVSHDPMKFNTNILPIIFYDKMKIAVDQNKPDNYRKNKPPQTFSSNAFSGHDYQKDQSVGQESAIANENDGIRGLESPQWKDEDDDFHSATACSEVYEHEETYLTLFDKVAMNPMKISDLFPRQLQLADHSGNSSNQESFFTAECPYYYEVSKFSTVYAQRMLPPPNQNNCCSDKQVGTFEYTAKSRTYQDGRIFRIEPDGEELAEVAIKREKDDLKENVDKIKVRIRLTDERNSKKPKPSVGSMRTETDMTINRSQKFSRSLADFNVKYKAIKEKIVDETKVITDGDNIKILIPLDSTNFENENNQ